MSNDKRHEVFCVHLDDWLEGGAEPDEQLIAVDLRFNQGWSMKDVVKHIQELRTEQAAA